MRTRLIFSFGCIFFLAVSSTAMAGESGTATVVVEKKVVVEGTDIAPDVNKDPKLQKWLEGIKPAAGVKYWEKKVVRRSSRRMVAGKE